ncbi:MAG: sensor histidine kinase [Saprospiraceae bacterium]
MKGRITLFLFMVYFINIGTSQDNCSFNQDTILNLANRDLNGLKNYVFKHFNRVEDDTWCRLMSYINVATYYSKINSKDSIIAIYNQLLMNKEIDKFPDIVAKADYIIGAFYTKTFNDSLAIKHLTAALSSKNLTAYDSLMSMIIISGSYNNIKKFDVAFNYLLEAKQKYIDSRSNRISIYINLLTSLGVLSENLKNFEEAIKYMEEAIQLNKKNKFYNFLTYYYCTLASSYSHLHNKEKAFEALDSASVYLKTNPNLESFYNFQKGQTYVAFDNKQEALIWFNKAYDYYFDKKEYLSLGNTIINLISIKLSIGDFNNFNNLIENFEKYCSPAFSNRDTLNIKKWKLISSISEYNTETAVSLNKLFNSYDQASSSDIRNKLNESQVKYETELKEKEILKLKQVTLTDKILKLKLSEDNAKLENRQLELINQQTQDKLLKDSLLYANTLQNERAEKLNQSNELQKAQLGMQTATLNTQKAQLSAQKAYLMGVTGILLLLGLLAYSIFRQYRKAKLYSEELSQKNKQINTLHREALHRTKNQLVLATSLISSQKYAAEDIQSRALLEESESKLRALAAVNKRLSDDEDNMLPLDEIVNEIISGNIFSLTTKSVDYKQSIVPMTIKAELLSSICLILNELSINSLKYAVNDNPYPSIKVSASKKEENKLVLEYSDNGKNVPKTKSDDNGGKGSQLIAGLVGQIRGRFEEYFEDGYHFTMEVPV